MGARPFQQRPLDGPDLLGAQPRAPPGAAGPRQSGLTLPLPAAMPHAGGLDADLQLSGDLSGPGSLGEERGRLATTLVACVEVSSRPKPDRRQGGLRER
jgi:hypothetical protein